VNICPPKEPSGYDEESKSQSDALGVALLLLGLVESSNLALDIFI
jgi:hypothetical protein